MIDFITYESTQIQEFRYEFSIKEYGKIVHGFRYKGSRLG